MQGMVHECTVIHTPGAYYQQQARQEQHEDIAYLSRHLQEVNGHKGKEQQIGHIVRHFIHPAQPEWQHHERDKKRQRCAANIADHWMNVTIPMWECGVIGCNKKESKPQGELYWESLGADWN